MEIACRLRHRALRSLQSSASFANSWFMGSFMADDKQACSSGYPQPQAAIPAFSAPQTLKQRYVQLRIAASGELALPSSQSRKRKHRHVRLAAPIKATHEIQFNSTSISSFMAKRMTANTGRDCHSSRETYQPVFQSRLELTTSLDLTVAPTDKNFTLFPGIESGVIESTSIANFNDYDRIESRYRVGSLIETMFIECWPCDVSFVQRNIFDVTRPFPVTQEGIGEVELCGCPIGSCSLDGERPCINIATCNVCDTWNCSAGIGCGNRFEQSNQLHLVKTPIGYGVAAEGLIPAGEFVVEYTGEILYHDDAMARKDKRYLVELPSSAGPPGHRLYIDAKFCGNISRFINHSCDPNCVMYSWKWANSIRLGIFALRDIEPFTELCFSYRKGNLALFTCSCGSERCVSCT